mgnify:CR=1 FL=1
MLVVKRLKDINWNQVYCFFEVARNGSMKKAAELLSVSYHQLRGYLRKYDLRG